MNREWEPGIVTIGVCYRDLDIATHSGSVCVLHCEVRVQFSRACDAFPQMPSVDSESL